jgi:signal transduction histidine kinase/CheY-like chemotaxis protein
VEFRWLARNSEWRWLRARVSQVTDETGRDLTHGIFIDVTEQKRLEEHIRQVQKMEALGQLTGGVAHDFNNILTVVVGNGELLRASLPEHDDRREDLDAILEAGERGAALTRQLMAFSRRDVREPRPIDLRQLVTTLAPMLRRVIGEDVRLSLSLEPGLPLVHADAGQLEQVLVNLAVNARNAMPTGGDLAISSQLLTLTDEYVDGPAPVSGQFVVLAVADTGCGMDDATRQRAFEPFFTTKPQGRGTGLGLSTCYGIIKQTDGHIHLDSAPDRGTTVRMYLPPMPGVEDESRPGEDRGQGGLTGQETILLVEDDAHVRATVERVLIGAGYHVITAVDGDHAQAVAVTTSGPIHLIVSDVVMPGAAGPEIVARLQSVLDGTKVLFMSGYTDHAQLRDGVAKSGAHFLRKPFAPVALLETVREVLDA